MLDLKAMEMVEPEDRKSEDRLYFSVHPNTLYPAMIGYIEAAIAGDVEVIPTKCHRFLAQAIALDAEAWKLASVPYSEINEEWGGPKGWSARRRQLRASALEICRRWFTAALHGQYGDNKPMGLHILAGDREWRL